MQDDLNRLVVKPPAEKRLPDPVTPPAIRAQTGLERESGGKINTKVAEVQSTDGLFIFDVTLISG
jgi:hypothetical protein